MRSCSHCGALAADTDHQCAVCGGELSAAGAGEMDENLGRTFGRYRIEELIGAGAMSRVYRARMLEGGHEVALKVLSEEDSRDPVLSGRFQQEARAMGRLRHEHNLTVLDFGRTHDGRLFFVTEVLRGRTLEHLIADEAPLDPRRIVELLAQALDALAEAHGLGIIHRDFKPDNVFVELAPDGGERVRVIDYGIAKVHTEIHDPRLTASGSVCGTPDYMAPEQIRGDETDGRADVYATGVVLYEMLTGTRPFSGSLLQVLTLHMQEPPEPPTLRRLDRVVPVALERVCLRALAKSRETRYPSAAMMRADLLAALPPPPPEEGEPPPPRMQLPFVGRQAELDALEAVKRGALLLLGPGGSGRSRLIEEWRLRLVERGERVLVMRCDPSTARVPWRPVQRALARALSLPERPTPEQLDEVVRDRPGDRLGLREVFGLGGHAPAEERAFRKREALAAALGLLRDHASSLACEDVDRYDRPSVEVVMALLADPGTGRVVASATSRGDLPEVATVTLGPLAGEVLTEGGIDLEGMGFDRHWPQLPLTVEIAHRAALELAADASPRGRVEALLPPARRVLAAAVVAGLEADAHLLLAATALSDVQAPLTTLEQRGLVRLEGRRAILPSPTLRDALYNAIDVSERAALHRTIGGLLETAGEPPALVAHHLFAAEPDAVPLSLLERAMEASGRDFDDPGAVRWGVRALRRARLPGSADPDGRPAGATPGTARLPPRPRVAVFLGESLLRVGDPAYAEQALREALGGAAGDALAAATARLGLARAALARGQAAAAEQEIGSALALLPPSAVGAAARVAVDLALELAALRDTAGRGRDADSALAQGSARVSGAPEAGWRLLLARAERALAGDRADEAQQLAQQALAAVEGRGTDGERARVETLLAWMLVARGETLAADRHRAAAIEGYRAAGDRLALAELLLRSSLDAGRDRPEVRGWLAEAGELARQVGWSEGLERAQVALRRFD